ncbi:MAG: exosortase A [Piscirickettsiaceae bacterium]|nr:MAG: exosortase A [Piscirickettsiaceae bacterium]
MTNNLTNTPWSNALKALVLTVVAIVAVYFQTIWSMVDTWWHYGTYTHGFVIFPISIYLLWQRREQLSVIQPTNSWLAVFFLFLSSVFWLMASLVGVTLFMQVAFISMIISTVWATLGTRFFLASLFPLAYLFFAVPFGEQLIPVMIDVTAEFTVWAIQLTGIPVYQEGRFLTLPTGNWEVAEACSGVRYIIASFALGSIFAYLNYQSFSKRFVFIILSLLVPILANGLRAFGIVMIGHFSDMALATGVDHLIYGWLFFGLVMFLLFWAGMYWADPEPEFVPVEKNNAAEDNGSKSNIIAVTLVTVLVAISGGLLETFLRSQQTQNMYSIKSPALNENSGWQGPINITSNWDPVFPGAQELKAVTYQHQGKQVSLYVAHYEKESEGMELISSTNRVFNLDKWEDESTTSHQVVEGLDVKEIIYRGVGGKQLVWEWYEIGSTRTNNVLSGKIHQAVNILEFNEQGNRLIALSTPYGGDVNESRKILNEFLRDARNVVAPAGLIDKN